MTGEIRNVVVVVVDALRRDAVGTYGSAKGLTPNIDDLASGGTVFENAFSCTNATDPSVTSMHSGHFPETVVEHHGPFVTDEEKRRAERVRTVPEILQDDGVRTLVTGRTLGRWHRNGFDHYPEPPVGRYERRAIGQRLGQVSPLLREVAGTLYERLSSAMSSASRDEMTELLDAVDDGPFYGVVHLMETHVPYAYDDPVVDELLERHDYPDVELEAFFGRHADNPYVSETMREYSEDEDYETGLARWFAKYDAAVARADRKVGALVEGLRRRGLAEETAIVLTSDHGESLDEHGIFFEHHGLYDPEIRVPLVVAGPSIPRGRRDELVQLHDLAPTILDLLDAPDDPGGDGRSLQPLLGGPGSWDEREHVVVQEAHAQSRRAIRTREFKLVEHVEDEVLEERRGDSFRCSYCDTVHGSERDLYDLRADPDETRDVSGEFPERAADLHDRLESYFDGLDHPESGGADIEYEGEEEVLDRLEDLGYR